jgi:two-component system, OmpR family, sensor histidine kinase BaeS
MGRFSSLGVLIQSAVRLSIRFKLFLALLAAVTLVIVAMYGFMQWSFQQGFANFLDSRQQARVDRVVAQLAEIYAEEQGWSGLYQDRRRWRWLMAEGRADFPHSRGMPERGEPEGRLHESRLREPGLVLLDGMHQVVVGRVREGEPLRLTPIKQGGQVVGYVGYRPGPPVQDRVDDQFRESQRRAFLFIALLVGSLALALAWPLANTLIRPLQRVTEATRHLAAGRFNTRVPDSRQDELGDLARNFNDMAQALERTDGARRQWMADISHELRTPLAVLRAELEALQDGVRPLDQAGVAALHGDVVHLGRLVDDLYQLSMSDLGALSYHKRSVDPMALLEDEMDALAGEFARHQLGLALQADSGAGVTMHGDPDRLSQLFRNLLQNSLRYTDGGGRLEIRASRQAGGLHLDFCDTAPGVPEEALSRLFERFYRVEASRNRASGGAGLGLAICRNIVAAHGGRIEARPSGLGGVCIHVELPLEAHP